MRLDVLTFNTSTLSFAEVVKVAGDAGTMTGTREPALATEMKFCWFLRSISAGFPGEEVEVVVEWEVEWEVEDGSDTVDEED